MTGPATTGPHLGDGYDGPAELEVEGRSVPVDVTLRGHFDPITGSYRWYGRIAARTEVADVVASGIRTVTLRTPFGAASTALTDIDTWGRPRVEGIGAAPFDVLRSIEDPDAG
jgi:hypothetical protein